jgi:Zn-finger nucleic acid-binding protein
MKCARCDGVLKPQNYEGVEIDRCPKCQGTWLDEGELQKIIATDDVAISPEIISQAITSSFAGVPEDEGRSVEHCPRCSKPMLAMNYSYSSGVIIDRCPNADGLWLDGIELDKIQAIRDHWDSEMSVNRDQWVGLVRNLEVKKTGSTADKIRSSASKYWVGSVLQRLFK